MTTCLWCGRRASPVRGVFLERLYPGRTTCDGCGLLQVECACEATLSWREFAPVAAFMFAVYLAFGFFAISLVRLFA